MSHLLGFLFALVLALATFTPILWLLLQLGCLSPLAIHPLWVSFPLHPSFGLSPTSPICGVLIGISFGLFMALFPLLFSNLCSELILQIYCAVLGNPLTFFLLLDLRMGGVSLSLVHFSRVILVS
jgi:hypothetical protein